MRVLTFSRTFPPYHPKAGQPTYFVEKINTGLFELGIIVDLFHLPRSVEWNKDVFEDCDPKFHTLRAGHRWKAGDYFSPRVWSGMAYRSKQDIIGPDIEIKKTWDIVLDECGVPSINGFYDYSDFVASEDFFPTLAKNDGLSEEDLHFWFPLGKKFDGQIICWNEKIEY